MATPQAGEASQEMMAKMNASMAAILRLAELIKLYALIGKMQLLSSPKIVEMAERIAHAIHETYRGPKKTFNDIEGFLSSDAVNPLRAFSEACRNELRTSGPLL